MFTLLSLVSMYSFLSLVDDSRDKRHKLILIITNTLLLYTHFFGFWIILLQILCVLGIRSLRQKFLKDYLLVFVIPLILFLPYIKIFLDRFFQSASQGTWVRPPKGIIAVFDLLRTFMNEVYGSTMMIKPVLTFITLVIIGLACINFIWKRSFLLTDKRHLILVTWFIFPLLAVFLLSFFVPMLIDRYMVFISPAFFLLIGLSLEHLHKNAVVRQVAAILLLGLMILTCRLNPDNHRDVLGVVERIKELKFKDKTVVYISPEWFDLNFVYYYRPEWFKEADNQLPKGIMKMHLRNDGIHPVFTYTEIDTLQIQQFNKIVFLDAGATFSIPDNGVFDFLNTHYRLMRQTKYPEIFIISEFEKR